MKLAVLFPGIGYHVDKPLLYYGRKLAVQRGYEVVGVPYGNFPDGVKGSPEKMKQAFLSALEQAEEILREVDFGKYEEILFISKSVGTAVASAYGAKHRLRTRNLYFTPVEESFSFMEQPGVVFQGNFYSTRLDGIKEHFGCLYPVHSKTPAFLPESFGDFEVVDY